MTDAEKPITAMTPIDIEEVIERAAFARTQDYTGIHSYRVARDFAEAMDDRDTLLEVVERMANEAATALETLSAQLQEARRLLREVDGASQLELESDLDMWMRIRAFLGVDDADA